MDLFVKTYLEDNDVGKKQFSADTTIREVRNSLLRGNISADGREEEQEKEQVEKPVAVEPMRYSLHEKSVCNMFQCWPQLFFG